MPFLNPILSVLTTLLLSILATTLGYLFYKRIFTTKLPLLDLSISFFIGLSTITICWRLLAFLTHRAGFSLESVLLLALAACYLEKKNTLHILKQFLSIAKNKAAWLIILLTIVFTLAIELDPQFPQIFETLQKLGPSKDRLYPDASTIFANIGSEHSGIHSEVASFIREKNNIPVTALDIGRSLLSAMPLFARINLPVFNSFLWLIVAKIGFLALLFGFLQKLGLNSKNSFYGVLIVLLGNTALSSLHIILSSTMSPVFFINYAPPIIVLGLFLTAILWMIQLPLEKRTDIQRAFDFLFIFVLTVSCIFGIHLLILLLPTIALFLILMAFLRKYPWINTGVILGIAGLTTIYCIFSGCGLTPQKFREKELTISRHVDQINQPSALTVNPFVWYSAAIAGTNYRGHTYYRVYDSSHTQAIQSARQLWQGDWKQKFFGLFDFCIVLEEEIWFALRMFFFSIAGFLLTFLAFKKFEISNEVKNIFYISLFIFLSGFFLTFFFDFEGIAGMRNTLSRFAHPGSILGLIMLTCALSKWIPHFLSSPKRQKIAWRLLLLIICFGPTVSLLTESINNMSSNQFFPLIKFLLTH